MLNIMRYNTVRSVHRDRSRSRSLSYSKNQSNQPQKRFYDESLSKKRSRSPFDDLNNFFESPLMSFRDFVSSQDYSIGPDKAIEEYEKYKNEHFLFHARKFFKQAKVSETILNSYHPTSISRNYQNQVKLKKFNYDCFLKDYENHHFKDINFVVNTQNRNNSGGDSSDSNNGDHVQTSITICVVNASEKLNIRCNNYKYCYQFSYPPLYINNYTENMLVIYKVPDGLSSDEIQPLVQERSGFISMFSNFKSEGGESQRNIFFFFDTSDNRNAAKYFFDENLKILNSFELKFEYVVLSNDSFQIFNIKVMKKIFDTKQQISSDITKSLKLLKKFDIDYKIVDLDDIDKYLHPIFDGMDNDENISKSRILDIQLLYLYRVHNFCYYCGKKYSNLIELLENCGPLTLRNEVLKDEDYNPDDEDREILAKFNEIVDVTLESKLEIPKPVDENHPDVKLNWSEFCDQNIMKVEEGRYRCCLCRKLFKGPEFVHKHLKNKHLPYLTEIIDKVGEKMLEERYILDVKQNYDRRCTTKSRKSSNNQSARDSDVNFNVNNRIQNLYFEKLPFKPFQHQKVFDPIQNNQYLLCSPNYYDHKSSMVSMDSQFFPRYSPPPPSSRPPPFHFNNFHQNKLVLYDNTDKKHSWNKDVRVMVQNNHNNSSYYPSKFRGPKGDTMMPQIRNNYNRRYVDHDNPVQKLEIQRTQKELNTLRNTVSYEDL